MLETAVERERQLIYQRGKATGWAEGEVAGWTKGKHEGQAELLIHLLEVRFGLIDEKMLV